MADSVIHVSHYPSSIPSRVCLICDTLEYPDSMFSTNIGWICPECANRIKRVIYPEVDNG